MLFPFLTVVKVLQEQSPVSIKNIFNHCKKSQINICFNVKSFLPTKNMNQRWKTYHIAYKIFCRFLAYKRDSCCTRRILPMNHNVCYCHYNPQKLQKFMLSKSLWSDGKKSINIWESNWCIGYNIIHYLFENNDETQGLVFHVHIHQM